MARLADQWVKAGKALIGMSEHLWWLDDLPCDWPSEENAGGDFGDWADG